MPKMHARHLSEHAYVLSASTTVVPEAFSAHAAYVVSDVVSSQCWLTRKLRERNAA